MEEILKRNNKSDHAHASSEALSLRNVLLPIFQNYKGICKIACSIIWGSYIKAKSSLKTLLKTEVYRESTSFSFWHERRVYRINKTWLSFNLLAFWGVSIFIILSSYFYAYGLMDHSFLHGSKAESVSWSINLQAMNFSPLYTPKKWAGYSGLW